MDWLLDDPLRDPLIFRLTCQKFLERRDEAHRSYLDTLMRVDRAGEHLADLKSRIDAYAESQKDNVGVESNGSKVRLWNRVEPAPRELSVVIGETIQNLRTALDYLVYALAILDSGTHPARTQFLIEDTREGFQGRRATCLKGLSVEHVAAIEQLQPFNGVNWTKVLRDQSNRDKHRALTVVGLVGTGEAHFGDPVDPADPDGKVHVDFTPTLDVTFGDETPVGKALEILESEVRAVIDGFQPDFARPVEGTVNGMHLWFGPPSHDRPPLQRSIESPAAPSGMVHTPKVYT